MAEISASMVMDLRQRTGLGMMECKKALTETAGDLVKAEELLRIKSGAKASKAPAGSRPRAWSARTSRATARSRPWSKSIARPTSCRATTTSSRSRRRWRSSSRDKNPADVAALAGAARSAAARSSRARVALVQKIGENIVDPPLRALHATAARLVSIPARRRTYRRHGRLRRRRRHGRQGCRDAHRGVDRQLSVRSAYRKRPGSRRPDREGTRDLHGAGCRHGQAGRHRRQDGRRTRQQVPRGGHPAGPAVRQESRR